MREKVIEIIAYEGSLNPEMIFDSSRLELDLGITGDDLWDILDHMDREFSIDWGETDFSYYFYPESTGFIWESFHRKQAESIALYPITVSHLIKVAEKGSWFKPERVNL